MDSIELIARGKINLYLEIIGHRADGYHELVMILQTIDLADRLILETGDSISVSCSHAEVPTDETNLAYKAARLMQSEFNRSDGVKITIDKQIPVAAGLAGGSCNAAAVLVGINQLWSLGLTLPELQVLGGKIGSDVPFCLSGGTAIATGRGEKLDPILDLESLWVVLGKYDGMGVSTSWAYQTYRQQFGGEYNSSGDMGSLLQAITSQNGATIGKLLYNDLEKVVLPEYGAVKRLREAFANAGVVGMMSGSGPTVFALCESEVQAKLVQERTREAVNEPNLHFWVTKFASTGIELLTTEDKRR